jgi:competence protein ComEC
MAQFLNAVQPEYAVISVGKDNGYGHPHAEVLERLNEIGAKVLRTDELGTIVFQSDGESLIVNSD